jgi:outer membrane autotransporter protein
MAMGRLSYPLAVDGVAITPFAEVSTVRASQNQFSEGGASPIAGSAAAAGTTSVQSAAGVRAHKDMAAWGGTLAPYLGATWAHEYRDLAAAQRFSFSGAPGAVFVIDGLRRPGDLAEVDAGVVYRSSGIWSLALGYGGDFASGLHGHAARAAVLGVW